MDIWLMNFPLPPTVNEYLMPVAGRWAVSKKGKRYQKGGFVKTKLHSDYLKRCYEWRALHNTGWQRIQEDLHARLESARRNGLRFALRVDTYFAFEESRLWTVNNLAQQIDADNRLKPCRDALSKLLGIDDKHFFGGFFEKITTHSKEYECSTLRITLMTPRTLEDLKTEIQRQARTRGTTPPG